MNKKYLIIYHKEDNDGLFSCGITLNYLINELHLTNNDIELFGGSYNDLYKMSENFSQWKDLYKSIIIVDISFPGKFMKQLYDIYGNNFIWIDHHLPIIKESFKHKFDSCNGIRQTDRSALALTYRFFYDQLDEKFQNKTINKLLHVLSSYDSWTYEEQGYTLDYVNAINKYINYNYNLDIDSIYCLCYDILYNNNIDNIFVDICYDKGKILLNYDKYNYENLINNYGDFDWVIDYPKNEFNKRSACAVFIQGPSSSIMFESKENIIDNGIVFKRNPEGSWTISLYNSNKEDEFHCGEYLKKKYKGGGHKGAAGCTVTEKQFLKILKTKIL